MTFLSIATAAFSLGLGNGSCVAGDKIDFSIPGNPALGQQPARELKVEESSSPPLRLGYEEDPTAGGFSSPGVSAIIIPNESRKQKDLRAWDSGLKPFGSQDRDNFDPAESAPPPTSRAFTNDFSAKSEWNTGPTAPRAENFSGLANPRSQGEGSATYRNVTSAWSSLSTQDTATRNNPGDGKAMDAGTISAWSKTFSSPTESYSERVRDSYRSDSYRSMYSLATPETEDSSKASKLPVTPTPGVGDSSILSATTAGASWGAHASAPAGFGSSSFLGGVLHGGTYHYGIDTPVAVQGQNPQRLPYSSQYGNGGLLATPAPAILPFPKKPGSLFQ